LKLSVEVDARLGHPEFIQWVGVCAWLACLSNTVQVALAANRFTSDEYDVLPITSVRWIYNAIARPPGTCQETGAHELNSLRIAAAGGANPDAL